MGQCLVGPAGRLTKKAPAHAHEVTLAGDSSRERERERERESRFHELAACKTLALIQSPPYRD